MPDPLALHDVEVALTPFGLRISSADFHAPPRVISDAELTALGLVRMRVESPLLARGSYEVRLRPDGFEITVCDHDALPRVFLWSELEDLGLVPL